MCAVKCILHFSARRLFALVLFHGSLHCYAKVFVRVFVLRAQPFPFTL